MFRILITLLFFIFSCPVPGQNVQVNNLRCNSFKSPLGIDSKPPVFSWQISSKQNGFIQSACQLYVSDNYATLKNRSASGWNSGKIKTDQSINISYAGKTLSAARKYYWRVKVWDKNNQGYRSIIDSFTTALFTKDDWGKAKWIGYDELADSMRVVPGVHFPGAKSLGNKAMQRSVVPLFRKKFSVTKKIKNATAFITGLGQYEFMLNGKKVGNSFLAPGWTYYDKRVLYNVYDITKHLKNDDNAIGVIVGNGFYNINRERYFKFITAFGFPKMICKINIEYEDGSVLVIVSDKTWKTSSSPITYSSIFGGEDYDARLEQEGWDQPGFDDKSWQNALAVKAPKGLLEPESIYPVIIKDSFEVKKIIQPAKEVFVYDFGQNASGIIEVKLKGKKGQIVRLIPSELLNKERLANQNASGDPYYYNYTLKGEGIETWKPLFTYYGFRYVQVEGAVPDTVQIADDLPRILNLKELHNSTSAPETGSFQSSNDLFNKINTLIKWAIQSNIQSVVTDCPHREKLSWLEQDYLMGKSIHYNLDIYQLYKKLVHDMMDAQTPEGLVPDIAPEFVPFDGGFRDSPEWGSAAVILPWQIYKWYGDKTIIRDAYPVMKKYIAYLEGKSDHQILSHGLGDWYDYGPRSPGEAQLTPKALTATAIYYYDVALLSKMAALLGDKEEVKRLTKKASIIKEAFNKRFFNPVTKVYSTGSQTAMVMPICVGLVDEKDKAAVFKNMVDSISLSGKKLTAGDIGYHFLVEALHAAGASQLLYDMNDRDDVAGYGFQLKKGATALTESWAALEEVSNNHLMLGHIMEWFYYGLAGISQSDSSVAYKDIIIRPEVVGDLTHIKGSFQSPYGLIASEWTKNRNSFELRLVIPANTRVTVFLPAAVNAEILLDGQPLKNRKDVKLVAIKDGRAIIKTGSGLYKFSVTGF